MEEIIIKGLTQNNLKNISLRLPKNKIIVFTGVSGSGKSSIVFDTIAAESQRQINETYSPYVRSRLPKYEKPQVESLQNLTASVIVDQSRLGGNIRSTVGTISDLYSILRLLFSRIGSPFVGTSSCFSFNSPDGMCLKCSGLGKVVTIDIESIIDKNKSWNEGALEDSLYKVGSWSWRKYANCGLFDLDKPIKDYSEDEYNKLLYGCNDEKGNKIVEGLQNEYERKLINRDLSNLSDTMKNKSKKLMEEKICPVCNGKRLNDKILSCKILGYSIAYMCEMEFTDLKEVLLQIHDKRAETLVETLVKSLDRLIDIGLPYLNLNRLSLSLSGGEAQRLKLVRYMGSSLNNMTYIFDEPSTGLHPRDVHRMNNLLISLRDKGNTVLVVEHDKDVIKIADEIVDIGPDAGKYGGRVCFQGSYDELLKSDTKTAVAMKTSLPVKKNTRKITKTLSIRNANLYNLKNVNVDIPLNVMTVVTGVAGSGKSTLITEVFAKQYSDDVVIVNQDPITATNRSMPVSYLGIFDDIRKLFAKENNVDVSLFSFNSKGGCKACKGKGVIVTELAFMDPVVTTCEECNGARYSKEALSYKYKDKNIMDVLSLNVSEAIKFFDNEKILKKLKAMDEVGLSYLTLGQPMSTLSGGELQRIKLAKDLYKKGNIYILDEPTTGLHMSDIEKLMNLFNRMVDRGNTIIIIEHNTEVMKQADYIIDIGPDGGKNGGQVVFTGTPLEMIEHGDTITAEYLRKS